MNDNSEWTEDRFWLEAERNGLYPPEKVVKERFARKIISKEDFSDKQVLDAGCGSGWLGALIKNKNAEVIGIDINNSFLREAKRSINVLKEDICKTTFKNESFDYIFSFMVLHVLEHPEEAIKEMARILKPNGIFYLGIVNPDSEEWNNKDEMYVKSKDITCTEKREWRFNLKNNQVFSKHYINRPIDEWMRIISPLFYISAKYTPKNPTYLTKMGRYATNEYLFMRLAKR
jgi:SAM-dependent methyltransferase